MKESSDGPNCNNKKILKYYCKKKGACKKVGAPADENTGNTTAPHTENKKEVNTDRGLDTLPSSVAGSPSPLNGKRALPRLDTLAIEGTSGVLVGEEVDNFPPQHRITKSKTKRNGNANEIARKKVGPRA